MRLLQIHVKQGMFILQLACANVDSITESDSSLIQMSLLLCFPFLSQIYHNNNRIRIFLTALQCSSKTKYFQIY